jgi:hypothetical protein
VSSSVTYPRLVDPMWIAGERVGLGLVLVGDRSGNVVPSLIYQTGHVGRREEDDVSAHRYFKARQRGSLEERDVAVRGEWMIPTSSPASSCQPDGPVTSVKQVPASARDVNVRGRSHCGSGLVGLLSKTAGRDDRLHSVSAPCIQPKAGFGSTQ